MAHGYRLRGLGQRGAVPGGALPTTTVTTLPARGAQYQTVVPTRTGSSTPGVMPTLPVAQQGYVLGTVSSASTGSSSSTPGQQPSCPLLTYWNSATGKCVSLPTPAGSTASQSSATTSYLPLLLIGAGVVLVMVLMSHR